MSSQSPVAPVVVTLAGQSYELKVPVSFLPREALNAAFYTTISDEVTKDDTIWGRLLWAAFVGVYIPQLIPQGLTLKGHRWQVTAFGEAVYDHLRDQGVDALEIIKAGVTAHDLNRASLAPREHEVSEVAGN